MAASPERGRAAAKTAESTTGGRSKSRDKKKKKGKSKKASAIPKDMAMNEKGELIPAREYVLEQTLVATSKSLDSYRERMTGLVHTNEDLQEACQQQEKDALEVIAALHRENEKRETRIKDLRQQIEDEAQRTREERDNVVEEYERKISDMSVIVTEKEAACNVMQQEFSVIKDFRKKRHDLIKELDQQRQLMTDTERRHSETVARMERKFFEEKIRLQKEANRKISELATKAHKEAVANLKETEKEVFRQNIRISEALQYHVQEGEEMAKTNAELVLVNRQLLDEKNLHDVIVKEKITQTKQQAREIKELKLKIQSMEHTLSHVVREFEHERDMMGRLAKRELDEVRKIASKLNEGLTRKSKETRHIKRLAQHILDQRTDLERFFMDALDHVRGEIHEEKEAARKAAQQEYNRRMKAILTSRGLPSSTSAAANTALPVPGTVSGLPQTSVVMPASTSPLPASSKVELSELSWEDKEKIMRLLFARMNGMSLVGKAGGEFAEAAAPTEDAGIRAESETGAEEIGANDFREDEAIQGREVDIGFDDDPEDETWSERNGFDQQALPVAVGWT